MDETQDQVQEDNPKSESPEVIKKEDQAPKEQSETTKDVSEESPTYDVLGKSLSAEELYDSFKTQQAYVTRLETDKSDREATAQSEAADAVSKNELLANVDPNVRDAIINIVTPVIESALESKEVEASKLATDQAFDKTLKELESKYSGGDGLPKFSRDKILSAMQEKGNNVFDPEVLFKIMNQEAFNDQMIKEAIKAKSGSASTETARGSSPSKPKGKSPKTFDEASKSAASRF